MKQFLRHKGELFIVIVVASGLIFPVFSHMAFYTNDGPAHLFNSSILKELLNGQGAFYLDYLNLNTRPEPNWVGHFLLVTLLFLFKPLMAEKVLVLIYVVLFLLGFRYLVRGFNKQNILAVVLAAPLVHSFPLYIGFYNFLFGVVCLLFTLGYWLRHREQLSLSNFLMLGFLFAGGFFSHITTFLVCLMCVGVLELHAFFTIRTEIDRKTYITRWLKLVVTLSPTLCLTYIFVSSHGGSGIPENLISPKDQWADLFALRPITVFHHFDEEKLTRWLFMPLIITTGLIVLLGAIDRKPKVKMRALKFKNDFGFGEARQGLLIIALIFLLGYFVLPDWMASGGYVHVRLSLLFFLFIFLWIATSKTPILVILPLCVAAVVTTAGLFDYRKSYQEEQHLIVTELVECSEHLPAHQTVLPIIENRHWFFSHAGNYLGALKPVLVLDNYEADAGYFPLQWKMSPNPAHYLGHPVAGACGDRVLEMLADGIPVDAIVHYKDGTKAFGENCSYTIEELERDHFTLVYTSTSGLTRVYLKKEQG